MKKVYTFGLSVLFSAGAFAQNQGQDQLNMSASQGSQSSAQIVVTPGVENVKDNKVIDIYSFNNKIFINPINFNHIKGNIEVYDLGGKMIISEVITNELQQIDLNETGIFIVTVRTEENAYTEKVFVR